MRGGESGSGRIRREDGVFAGGNEEGKGLEEVLSDFDECRKGRKEGRALVLSLEVEISTGLPCLHEPK